MRDVPYWALYVVVLLAVLLSPILSLSLVFIGFELLWALVDALGLPVLFATVCLVTAAGILLRRGWGVAVERGLESAVRRDEDLAVAPALLRIGERRP